VDSANWHSGTRVTLMFGALPRRDLAAGARQIVLQLVKQSIFADAGSDPRPSLKKLGTSHAARLPV